MRIRKAMVLAAGEGTRLRPLTETRAKPVIPVLDRPLIGHTLRLLARYGIEEVGVNLHHLPGQVREVVGDGGRYGLSVRFSFEEELLGTAGAVKRMESLFDEDFFVIYGDNFLSIDLGALADLYAAKRCDALIGLFRSADPSSCGIVERDAERRVTRFIEKPAPGETNSDAANAGIYVLSPRALETIPAATFWDFGRDVFPALLADGAPIYAEHVNGYLEDTGTFDRYRKVCFDTLDGKAGGITDLPIERGVYIAGDARFERADEYARGHVSISSRTHVDREGSVTDSILWEDCEVGACAAVADSILAERCVVGPGARVTNSVLGAGTVIAEHAVVTDCVLPVGSAVDGRVQGIGKER
jgi:NDP-sugar pyrophosphorylase family protein